MPDEVAVFAEPAAAALHVLDWLLFRMGDRMMLGCDGPFGVLGPGRLGLLVAQAFAHYAPVTVLGRRPESLAVAQQLGLSTGLADDAADDSFNMVVETSGQPQGLATALRLVRPRGIIVLKSTCAAGANVDLTPAVVKELHVFGSRCGRLEHGLAWLADGRLRTAELIEAEYPLSDALAAFAHAARPGALKVLLRP
jgi:threonine dehydrogenase-like Zn-dependent dehydrogenase